MLTISSKSHPYKVIESPNAKAAVADLPDREAAFYLVDSKVSHLYESHFANMVPESQTYSIEASEHAKSYEQLVPLFCWLLEKKIRRSSTLVVIGGGVLQDIGCFVASVLLRGVRWTLIPTTLLAQCDSCIGSKSSLNINRFKNQLGTFYPPHEVRLSFDFLATLTEDEINSGLGEAIKLHLVAGQDSVNHLQRLLTPLHGAPLPLREIVWESLRIKKSYIEQDEFDQGIRNFLNYGHTFAHALESATGYAIPHGIAVTMGTVFATYFADRLKLADPGYFENVLALTRQYFQKYDSVLQDVDLSAVAKAMKQDKKNSGDQVTFILSRRPGNMEKVTMDAAAVPSLMDDCRNLLKP